MKNSPIYWLLVSMMIGLLLGLLLGNIPAGICLGTSIGILTMLIAFTNVEKNNRN